MRDSDPAIVRPAREGDLDEIADVWHHSAMAMDGAADIPSRDKLRARVDIELQNGWSLFVAEVMSEIVGILALKLADSVLDQLFISPDQQDRGIGRRLLAEAKRQMPTGFVLRMSANNIRARRFYRNNGLTPLRTDVHPRNGRLVEFYQWTGC